MKFNEEELALVAKAKTKLAEVRIKRIALIVAMVIGVLLMLIGTVEVEKIAYFLITAVFLSVGLSQFGDGPNYEDLVKLLDEKAKARE